MSSRMNPRRARILLAALAAQSALARPIHIVAYGDSMTAGWLVAREETLGIPPRSVEQVNLYLGQPELQLIFLVTLILMPGAAGRLSVADARSAAR